MKQDPQPQLLYHNPHEKLELAACELARFLGIAVGLGAIPLLRDRPIPLWIVEAAAGVLVMAVGLFFQARRARRQKPPTPTPSLFRRLLAFLRGLPTFFRSFLSGLKRLPGLLRRLANGLRRAWAWVLAHLPGQRKAVAVPIPAETPPSEETPTVEAPVETPSAAAPAPSPARDLVLLPYQTLLVGLFLLLPAILVAVLQRIPFPSLDQVAIYFGTPALLIWVGGEFLYLQPKIAIKPWDSLVLTGILKSALQLLGAALVLAYLALALGSLVRPGLLLGGLGLALVGLALGLVSAAGERRRLPTRPPGSRLYEMVETPE